MKKLFSVLVILCWLALPGQSQDRQQRPVIDAYKTAFITRRLNLTPEEAQKFWPIYNAYNAEMRQANIVYRNGGPVIQWEEARLNIKKKYSVEFLKAISPGKINDFFTAERDFDAFILKELQRRKAQRRPFPDEQ
ncbi:MAG TPA: hypothetical protein VI233_12975 [Puia sp.]